MRLLMSHCMNLYVLSQSLALALSVAAATVSHKLKHTPTRTQIVACELGRLYNKSAILAHLLSRKPMPKGMRYIKGLKVRAHTHTL